MTETRLNESLTHRPLGFEAPYSHGPDERFPRWPLASQPVSLGVTVPLQSAPEQVYCRWRLNGVEQPALPLHKKGLAPREASPFLAVSPLNEAGLEARTGPEQEQEQDAQLCWETGFGPFNFGDRIEYTFSTAEQPEAGPGVATYDFSFDTRAWQPLALVAGPTGSEQLYLTWQGRALLNLTVDAAGEDSFRLRVERVSAAHAFPGKLQPLTGPVLVQNGPESLLLELEQGVDGIAHRLVLQDGNKGTILRSTAPWLEGLLTAAGDLESFRLNFSERGADFYGLGERFDHLNQRGHSPDIRVYEQYKSQGDRTYFPVPFGFSPDGFGLYVASSGYSRFDLPQDGPMACEVQLPGSSSLDIYLFIGTPARILGAYTALTGQPVLPPDWIYTPWISGNEWNSQAKIMEAVNRSQQAGIPVGVVVIEAWADETTFYVFNDAVYSPGDPARPPRLSDFSFPAEGHWPDPRGMVEELHSRGIKVLLWQIPVLKSFEEVEQSMAERALAGQKPQTASLEQHQRDTSFALEHGYVVLDADGTPYRNPGIWFKDAYVLDVTNPAACEWWMSKRAYLIEELGLDGFKTDGGEHLWGSGLRFQDGRRGAEMINAYPRLYTQMYFDALQRAGREGVTFSRAGFAGSQTAPCHWAGDENSTFEAFRHSIVAGLSAGLSGIPFWGWDIAGFSGPLPTAELYLRASAMSVFCPIMQYHSEYNAFRPPLRDRTPWNIAEQNGAPWLVEDFARLARLRLKLLPYIRQAVRHSARTGEPLMRALALDWPDDLSCRQIEDQYMFGPFYLVAPVVEEGADSRDVYLPAGQWRDFWDSPDAPVLAGGQWLRAYPTPLREKPALIFERLP